MLNALTAYSLFVVTTVDREGKETGSEGQSWKVCASSTSDGTRNNFLPPNRGIDAQKVQVRSDFSLHSNCNSAAAVGPT